MRKDEINSTVDSSDTDKIYRGLPVRETTKGKKEPPRNGWIDDEPLHSDPSESREEIISRVHVVRSIW